MTLCRPRANSLQLSVERLRVTTWRPARPPTPRRSTYPQPGTTSLDMIGIVDSDIPPVPPLSYWEPETPSPMSPHNPFLSPPAASPGSLKTLVSPILPASPLSVFDKQNAPRSWSFAVPLTSPRVGPDLSPRFLNPRTPPLPPIMRPGSRNERRRSTMCSVPSSEIDKMEHRSPYAMIATIQEKVRKEMKMEKKEEATGKDKSWIHRYNTVKQRRQRRNMTGARYSLSVIMFITGESIGEVETPDRPAQYQRASGPPTAAEVWHGAGCSAVASLVFSYYRVERTSASHDDGLTFDDEGGYSGWAVWQCRCGGGWGRQAYRQSGEAVRSWGSMARQPGGGARMAATASARQGAKILIRWRSDARSTKRQEARPVLGVHCAAKVSETTFRGPRVWGDRGMEAWRHGGMEAWRHGGMEAWRHGSREGVPSGVSGCQSIARRARRDIACSFALGQLAASGSSQQDVDTKLRSAHGGQGEGGWTADRGGVRQRSSDGIPAVLSASSRPNRPNKERDGACRAIVALVSVYPGASSARLSTPPPPPKSRHAASKDGGRIIWSWSTTPSQHSPSPPPPCPITGSPGIALAHRPRLWVVGLLHESR
ncbi:hypothetical protein P171DRAFT_446812 [Karstenula rhodostoma CBS 690.94]|uniref:Uncharacterized protein n=1 Tax=Karstenula rhodostoma CBS 690.94 TaxID=1392251 RepID=A0A9P4U857_9PLEO|nr:hypothetical protein P171DRAFT_446812 [Karstenula rhodostoma CBS 690.94]